MEPFLKWAGGKRWLTSKPDELFPKREEFKRYFEPFLGGGAVFFYLQPNGGYLSDVNSDLINSYEVIRDDWHRLSVLLTKYDALHNSDFYYQIRASTPTNALKRAARFLYLNRTCWNGLYRVNKKGQFNVPIGSKTKVAFESHNFEEISGLLSRMEILHGDFEISMNLAEDGDFIFVDPPYTVKHNLNGFVKYNETIFSWDDQIRLRNTIVRALNRGVQVLLLNADHASIRELYKGIGIMSIRDRASVIAGNAKARGIYSELVVKCW